MRTPLQRLQVRVDLLSHPPSFLATRVRIPPLHHLQTLLIFPRICHRHCHPWCLQLCHHCCLPLSHLIIHLRSHRICLRHCRPRYLRLLWFRQWHLRVNHRHRSIHLSNLHQVLLVALPKALAILRRLVNEARTSALAQTHALGRIVVELP